METLYGLVEGLARRIPLPLELEHRTFQAGTVLTPILTFWAAVAVTELFHRSGWFASRRVQPDREPKRELQRKALALVAFNTLVLLPLFVAPSYWLFEWSGVILGPEDFPGALTVVFHVIAFMLLEDTLFYWAHRGFHNKTLYRRYHRVHHQYLSPRPIAALYAHPFEFVTCNIVPVTAGPLIVSLLGSPVHITTTWVWLFVRALETVDGHSGFEFRFWFPHKLVYGSGATVHDLHHSANHGNFASFFPHWDRLGGTVIAPRGPAHAPGEEGDGVR